MADGDAGIVRIVEWGDPIVIQPGGLTAEEFTVTLSPSGQANTILFNGLELSLQTPEQPLSAVTVASLQIPVSVREEKVFGGFANVLRGFVLTSKGASASLTAHIGGAVQTLDFPGMMDTNIVGEGKFPPERACQRKANAGDEGAEGPAGQNFTAVVFAPHQTIPGEEDPPLRAISPYMATLVLSAQRGTPEDTVVLTLDSLDVGGCWMGLVAPPASP